jgi:HK97 gp10 family phage protein
MATGITTRVVWNRFPQIMAGMEQRAGQIVRKTALDLQAHMMANAPVDTGFLRSSIQAEKLGRSHWRVTVGADYGIYQEYGTRFQQAQPFFFPAVAEVKPAFEAAMRTIVSGGATL